jgi:PhzF family phenazine biosynthesis protein
MKLHRVAAFTKDGVGGNPAGVAICDKLPSANDMQSVAARLGYSETVFAAPKADGFLVRYYSPEGEVPFCGHATLALGFILGLEFGETRHTLNIAAGTITVRPERRGEELYVTLRSLESCCSSPSAAMLETCLQLFAYSPEDLDQSLPPVIAQAGARHLIVPLASRSALSAMEYDLTAGRNFMLRHDLTTIAFVFRSGPRSFEVRNAFASGGVIEDPATGAAAAALAGWLRDANLMEAGSLLISQGEDMGSPSRIDVTVEEKVGSPALLGGRANFIR